MPINLFGDTYDERYPLVEQVDRPVLIVNTTAHKAWLIHEALPYLQCRTAYDVWSLFARNNAVDRIAEHARDYKEVLDLVEYEITREALYLREADYLEGVFITNAWNDGPSGKLCMFVISSTNPIRRGLHDAKIGYMRRLVQSWCGQKCVNIDTEKSREERRGEEG